MTDPATRSNGRVLHLAGRYALRKVIGTGAFATVYEAEDEHLEDVVAIKILAENHSFDASLRERFLTEGRVLRRVDSSHVLRVYDLGETDDGRPFLVLEHANRSTLAQRAQALRAKGWQPSPVDIWAVAQPVALALSALHHANVVHRDLNPSNVLLTTRGVNHSEARGPVPTSTLIEPRERVLLADLGLCKDLALNSGLTVAGGTDGFRPPELRHGPVVIGPTADLWSLSALMVWLIIGSPPRDETALGPVRNAGLPNALAAALDRSLADEPSGRHPDPQGWLDDVRWALFPAVTPPGPDAAGTGTGARVPRGHGPPNGVYRREPGPLPVQPLSWKLKHSLWLLTNLGLSLTTWCGFLYIGLRAQRRAWLWSAGLYGAGLVAWLTLLMASPTNAEGEGDGWQFWGSFLLFLIVWIGGTIHGFIANLDWLRWLASQPEHVPRPPGQHFAVTGGPGRR